MIKLDNIEVLKSDKELDKPDKSNLILHVTHWGARVHFIILLWLVPDDFTYLGDEPCPSMS